MKECDPIASPVQLASIDFTHWVIERHKVHGHGSVDGCVVEQEVWAERKRGGVAVRHKAAANVCVLAS